MKAVIFRRHGGPDVLEHADVLDPVLTPDQILVRVKACSVNHLADPVLNTGNSNTDVASQVHIEKIPAVEPIVVHDEEPVEPPVREFKSEGTQRGFFVNGGPGLSGSSLEASIEPTTLALLGIMITLVTAALTLVRGR